MCVLFLVLSIFCLQQNILHIYADHLLSVWHESNHNLEKKKGLCVTGMFCSASKIFDIAVSIYILKDNLFKCFIASYK